MEKICWNLNLSPPIKMAYKIPKKINKKLTCRKIKYFEKDEKMASKEYKELGLTQLSKDEKNHYKFFKKIEKKKCK